MMPISKSGERRLLSKDDSFFLGEQDYLARFERKNKQVIYQSDCAVICLAEYFIDQYEPGDYWVLVYQADHDRYYSAVIKGQVVISEKTGTEDDVLVAHRYDLEESRCIVSNTDFTYQDIVATNVGPIDRADIPGRYITSLDAANKKRLRKKIRRYSLGLLVLMAAISWYVYIHSPAGSEQPVRVVDIYADYKADIASQISAYHAIEQATYLYALSLTFPDSMALQRITKTGNTLEMTLKKANLRMAVVQEWLNKNPQMKPLYHDHKFVLDLSGTAGKWLHLIVPVGGLPFFLHDKAIEMGGSNVSLSDRVENSRYIQRTFKAQFNQQEIGGLTLYNELLKNTPSFLTSLRITPARGKTSIVNVDLSITIKGQKNEQHQSI
ncbi:hypothetical protein [Vibrio quintilis]|uniref:Uncharacterized protein n=1 Tax=Vibrio quintilis TaxID=1117707 RepID=A0A1M7YSH1_9VIBR|nr:hypothetical protein [Vibrio quintilis]SHO55559.1 hypothetical protein VQ7734_01295 [Vibrio quintilis]